MEKKKLILTEFTSTKQKPVYLHLAEAQDRVRNNFILMKSPLNEIS